MSPESFLRWSWAAWTLSWGAAAFWSARSAKTAGFRAEAPYRAALIAGTLLLFGADLHLFRAFAPLWTLPSPAAWAAAAFAFAGFAFTWWARIHLGKLWSGWVGTKAGHRIVDTGPYAVVRHPIYTGLLAACWATALLDATLPAAAGAALFTAAFRIKARLEEAFLRRELGESSYKNYRARVPMLVPGLKRRTIHPAGAP